MSYPAKFRPEKYQEIEGVLISLKDLEPGGRMTLRGLTPEVLTRTRSLIYEWLYHMEMKSRFSLKTILGDLMIIRRGLPEGLVIDIDGPGIEARLENYLKQSFKESDAKEYFKSLLERGVIEPEDFTALLEKYNKVMS